MTVWALARLLHFLAFAVALGASLSAFQLHRTVRTLPVPEKSALERAAAELVTKRELVALFVALFAGVWLIVQHPRVLSAAESGAGPWLHVKLALVLVLLVLAHLRMFGARRLVRARGEGANEAECDERLQKTQRLAGLGLGLYAAVMFLAVFRVVLFAP